MGAQDNLMIYVTTMINTTAKQVTNNKLYKIDGGIVTGLLGPCCYPLQSANTGHCHAAFSMAAHWPTRRFDAGPREIPRALMLSEHQKARPEARLRVIIIKY